MKHDPLRKIKQQPKQVNYISAFIAVFGAFLFGLLVGTATLAHQEGINSEYVYYERMGR